jgi:hypothetical protein
VHAGENGFAEYDASAVCSSRREDSGCRGQYGCDLCPLREHGLQRGFPCLQQRRRLFRWYRDVEAFGTDAAKGTLLWEAVDKRGGTTALVADTLDNWRDVRNSFRAWGVQLRTRLQDLRVCRR